MLKFPGKFSMGVARLEYLHDITVTNLTNGLSFENHLARTSFQTTKSYAVNT